MTHPPLRGDLSGIIGLSHEGWRLRPEGRHTYHGHRLGLTEILHCDQRGIPPRGAPPGRVRHEPSRVAGDLWMRAGPG